MLKPVLTRRKALLIFIDFLIFAMVYLAFVLFAFLADYYITTFQTLSLIITILTAFVARFALSSYSCIWRYANSASYLSLMVADGVAMIASYFVSFVLYAVARAFVTNVNFGTKPGIFFMFAFSCVSLLLTVSSRLVYQYINTVLSKQDPSDRSNRHKIGVAIIGAGQIGSLVATELMHKGNSHYRPICFVDNNRDKAGQTDYYGWLRPVRHQHR